MIKQLVIMFLISILVGLIFQSHDLAVIQTTGESYLIIISYVIGYALALVVISLLVALVPRSFYWVMNKKKAPEFMILAWSIWILLVAIISTYQIYNNATQIQNSKQSALKIVAGSTAEDIYKKVANSIYTILGKNKDGKVLAMGGAVAVTQDYLVTNCHVIANNDHFTAMIDKNEKPGVLYSVHGDICIVKIPGTKFIPVEMRQSKDVDIGEDVYAIGNPEDFEKSISNGIISNKHDLQGITILQTNAAISHGSSGGGLFDHNGKLIGITTAAFNKDNAQNINFVLPTEIIEAAILEPRLDNVNTSEDQNTSSNTNPEKSVQNNKTAPTTDNIDILGVYGLHMLELARWNNSCYILIPGRYNPNTMTSFAIWMPSKPNGLIILSRVSKSENVFKFMKWINEVGNIQYINSQSRIFYNNKLIPLTLISVNNVNQPVYIYLQDKPMTGDLIEQDRFIGLFYDYSRNGYNGFTSIEFGLNGFTEALESYNQNCNGN